ncbi:coiled-coil domain-containing protein 55-domain containing protein [Lentinula edodes]|nr:coiled-coil domain-containing protein 55-domain containing protein [Lentinula edodes]
MSKLSFSLKKPKTAAPAVTASFRQPAPHFLHLTIIRQSMPHPQPVLFDKASLRTKNRWRRRKKLIERVCGYDQLWDKMQMTKLQQKEKPKYIHGLLTAAATRRLDRLRAEEKMMQREWELEGDEFEDKEAFATQAYKDQMEEVRKAEEEENRKDGGSNIKKQGRGTGIAHFYRRLLEDSEQSHEVTVAAAQKPIIGPEGSMSNMTIMKPPHLIALSDLQRARIARGEGKDVELNDDSQIIDKRDLLSGGLNLSGTNTRNFVTRSVKESEPDPDNVQVHRAVGVAASRQGIKERRMWEIELQMEEEQECGLKEQEREELEMAQVIIAKRNNEDNVDSARARYLERKRRSLEEAEDSGEQKLLGIYIQSGCRICI